MLFVSLDKLQMPLEFLDSIDGIELRLDLFQNFDDSSLNTFIQKCPKPVLLTLRSKSQGGKYTGKEDELEPLILNLLKLKPTFFDLEYGMRKEFLKNILLTHSDVKFIISHHSFEKELDVNLLYKKMQIEGAYGYKIAKKVSSTTEALKLMLFSKKHSDLSIICMGEEASFTRVLGPIVNNLIDYASLNNASKTAEGQLSIFELTKIYRYFLLNKETSLYGLIGDPINASQGHIYHNGVFDKKNCNAVYVKMKVKKEELSSFFTLAKEIGFKGLSVTMPLKEAVYEILPSSSHIKAVNTLLLKEKTIFSTNTDGKGALDALETRGPIQEKVVVILGAGGAARSIAFEAKNRGAFLWILNRSKEKALSLSEEIGCQGGGLGDFPEPYDVLINTAPQMEEFDLSGINSSTLVMDIVYNPKETPFLKRAIEKGAKIVYGDEMFFNQAALQTAFWEIE